MQIIYWIIRVFFIWFSDVEKKEFSNKHFKKCCNAGALIETFKHSFPNADKEFVKKSISSPDSVYEPSL